MKKIIIGLVILASFIGVSASAKVIINKIEKAQKDNIATVYVSSGQVDVYEIKMASSTCYVSYYAGQTGTLRVISHELSCIR